MDTPSATSDAVLPWLQESRYWPAYQEAVDWFGTWGFWAVFIAGFSPIPYKMFTIAAGALSMALLPFTLASLIGRGARFFIVAALMAWGGEAGAVGTWITATFSPEVLRWVLGLSFIGMAIWTLIPDKLDEEGAQLAHYGVLSFDGNVAKVRHGRGNRRSRKVA